MKRFFALLFIAGLVFGCTDDNKKDTTPDNNKNTKNNDSNVKKARAVGRNSDLCKGENCPGYVH